MGPLALIFWLLLAAGLPDVLPETFGLARHAPDLWVALVIYLACRGRGYAAVGWGILVGLLRDVHSLDPLGTHGFVLGLLGMLFAEGRRERGEVVGLARWLCVGAGVAVAGWVYALRMLPLGAGLDPADLLGVLPRALWTMLAAGPLFASADRLGALDDLCGRTRGVPA